MLVDVVGLDVLATAHVDADHFLGEPVGIISTGTGFVGVVLTLVRHLLCVGPDVGFAVSRRLRRPSYASAWSAMNVWWVLPLCCD